MEETERVVRDEAVGAAQSVLQQWHLDNLVSSKKRVRSGLAPFAP